MLDVIQRITKARIFLIPASITFLNKGSVKNLKNRREIIR